MPEEWQEVRLFISSTFKDMQAERDYLVRFVFPRIREELLHYHLYFIDVDLRWGITDEENIIGACRSIIDECHPLFLGILGGRYGWIPGKDKDSISVTEDEITHAVDNCKKSGYHRIMFLLRNEQDTLSMNETVTGEFREPEGSHASNKLALLKKKIRESDFPVLEYHARWDDDQKSLTNLQAFGEAVYRYIHDYVAQEFDLNVKSDNMSYGSDEAELELYIMQSNKFYIMEGVEEQFHNIETAAMPGQGNNVIMVEGSGGIGKSAFLCHFIQQCRKQDELIVIPHFVGITPNSAELSGMLISLCQKLLRYSPSNDPVPAELDRLIFYFQTLLLRLNKNEKYVLIIDGINQMKPDNGALELRWLPLQLPENVTLVLSTAAEEIAKTIRGRWTNLTEIKLHGLNADASRLLIAHYLERYQKRLSQQQIEILLSKDSTNVPLYLMTVIEELRIYGNYEKLTDFLIRLPGDTVSLLKWIIQHRIAESKEFADENGQIISQNLVKQFLSLLYISNSGLSENELTEILGTYAVNGNIAALIRQLRPFLSLHGKLLNFFHDDIRKAVFNVYIRHIETKSLHAELAGYFYLKSDPGQDGSFQSDSLRAFRELLYHTMQADDGKLVVKLINNDFFEAYCKMELPEYLLRSIREIVGFICKKAGGDISDEEENASWQAVLHALHVYAKTVENLTNTNADQPHPIERAIAEGRDEDVISLLRAVGYSKNTSTRVAAAAIYRLAGREEAARVVLNEQEEILKQKINPIEKIFCDILSGNVKPAEKMDLYINRAIGSYETLPQTKPKIRISMQQILALNLLGKRKIWYFIFYMILGMAFESISPISLIPLCNRIKFWANNRTFGKLVSLPFQLLTGLVFLAIPLLVLIPIVFLLYKLINKNHQITSMIAYVENAAFESRTKALMRLTRYCRLVNEAGRFDKYPRAAEKVLRDHLYAQAEKKQFDLAGQLLGCIAISGINLEDCSLYMLRSLPETDKKEIILKMLSSKALIYNVEVKKLLSLIHKTYGDMPPVAVLSALLPFCKKDKKTFLKYLNDIDKGTLAACLLRQKSISADKKGLYTKVSESISEFFLKIRFSQEPVPVEWYDMAIKLLLISIPLILIAVLFYLGFYFLGVLLFAFGFPVVSFMVICYLINEWTGYLEIPKNIDEYSDLILAFQNENRKVSADKKEKKKRILPKTDLTAAFETALTYLVIKKPDSMDKILQDYDVKRQVRVLSYAIRVDKPGKYRLIPGMLNMTDALPGVLSCIEKDETVSKKLIKQSIRRDFTHQWKSYCASKMHPLTALCMGLLSTLLCGVILFTLYQFPDAWMQYFIKKDGWILMGLSFLCFLIPLQINGVLLILPLTAFLRGFVQDASILHPDYGTFIFYFIPFSIALLSNKILIQASCKKLLFPTIRQMRVEKLKSVFTAVLGCLLIVTMSFFILIYNSYIYGFNPNPANKTLYALQDYDRIRFWAPVSKNINDTNPGERLYDFFTGRSVYQYNLVKRVKNSSILDNTAFALEKFGYRAEANLCRERMMEYVGWWGTYQIKLGETNYFFFHDNKNRLITIACVITGVVYDSQADKLGLREGDAITAVDGHTFITSNELTIMLTNIKKTAKITVNRNGRNMEFTVHPGKLGVYMGFINLNMIENISDKASVSTK